MLQEPTPRPPCRLQPLVSHGLSWRGSPLQPPRCPCRPRAPSGKFVAWGLLLSLRPSLASYSGSFEGSLGYSMTPVAMEDVEPCVPVCLFSCLRCKETDFSCLSCLEGLCSSISLNPQGSLAWEEHCCSGGDTPPPCPASCCCWPCPRGPEPSPRSSWRWPEEQAWG